MPKSNHRVRTRASNQQRATATRPAAAAEDGNPFRDALAASLDLSASQHAGLLKDLEPSLLKDFWGRYSLEDLRALPPGVGASLITAFSAVDFWDRLLQPLLDMPVPEEWSELKQKIEAARRARRSLMEKGDHR